MTSVSRADIDRLLRRHGIASTAVKGSDTEAAAKGGRIASIAVARNDGRDVLSLTMGETRMEASCPLDEGRASSLVHSLQEQKKLPADDGSFVRMLVDLLVKVSQMYAESEAYSLTLDSVHLHPDSYHIGRVVMLRETPLHVAPRRESEGKDRRATFSQRHRTDQRFHS